MVRKIFYDQFGFDLLTYNDNLDSSPKEEENNAPKEEKKCYILSKELSRYILQYVEDLQPIFLFLRVSKGLNELTEQELLIRLNVIYDPKVYKIHPNRLYEKYFEHISKGEEDKLILSLNKKISPIFFRLKSDSSREKMEKESSFGRIDLCNTLVNYSEKRVENYNLYNLKKNNQQEKILIESEWKRSLEVWENWFRVEVATIRSDNSKTKEEQKSLIFDKFIPEIVSIVWHDSTHHEPTNTLKLRFFVEVLENDLIVFICSNQKLKNKITQSGLHRDWDKKDVTRFYQLLGKSRDVESLGKIMDNHIFNEALRNRFGNSFRFDFFPEITEKSDKKDKEFIEKIAPILKPEHRNIILSWSNFRKPEHLFFVQCLIEAQLSDKAWGFDEDDLRETGTGNQLYSLRKFLLDAKDFATFKKITPKECWIEPIFLDCFAGKFLQSDEPRFLSQLFIELDAVSEIEPHYGTIKKLIGNLKNSIDTGPEITILDEDIELLHFDDHKEIIVSTQNIIILCKRFDLLEKILPPDGWMEFLKIHYLHWLEDKGSDDNNKTYCLAFKYIIQKLTEVNQLDLLDKEIEFGGLDRPVTLLELACEKQNPNFIFVFYEQNSSQNLIKIINYLRKHQTYVNQITTNKEVYHWIEILKTQSLDLKKIEWEMFSKAFTSLKENRDIEVLKGFMENPFFRITFKSPPLSCRINSLEIEANTVSILQHILLKINEESSKEDKEYVTSCALNLTSEEREYVILCCPSPHLLYSNSNNQLFFKNHQFFFEQLIKIHSLEDKEFCKGKSFYKLQSCFLEQDSFSAFKNITPQEWWSSITPDPNSMHQFILDFLRKKVFLEYLFQQLDANKDLDPFCGVLKKVIWNWNLRYSIGKNQKNLKLEITKEDSSCLYSENNISKTILFHEVFISSAKQEILGEALPENGWWGILEIYYEKWVKSKNPVYSCSYLFAFKYVLNELKELNQLDNPVLIEGKGENKYKNYSELVTRAYSEKNWDFIEILYQTNPSEKIFSQLIEYLERDYKDYYVDVITMNKPCSYHYKMLDIESQRKILKLSDTIGLTKFARKKYLEEMQQVRKTIGWSEEQLKKVKIKQARELGIEIEESIEENSIPKLNGTDKQIDSSGSSSNVDSAKKVEIDSSQNIPKEKEQEFNVVREEPDISVKAEPIDASKGPSIHLYSTTKVARWLNSTINQASDAMIIKNQEGLYKGLYIINFFHLPAKLLHLIGVAINCATFASEVLIAFGLVLVNQVRRYKGTLDNDKNFSSLGHLKNGLAYGAAAASDFMSVLTTPSQGLDLNNSLKTDLGIINAS